MSISGEIWAKIHELEAEIARLRDLVEHSQKDQPAKRGPGRPPKNQSPTTDQPTTGDIEF